MLQLAALVFVAAPQVGVAQRIEAGVKAGVPVAGPFETGTFFQIGFGESGASAARRFTGGPMAVVRFTRRLGLEVDALYQRLGFDRTTKGGGVFYNFTSAKANSWEFPLLGRMRLRRIGGAEMYVSAGPSFRAVSGVSARLLGLNPIANTTGSATHDYTFDNRSHFGGAAAAGLRVRAGPVYLSPEIRYTRWREDAQFDPYLHSQQNQVAFLLGVTL